jgi:hypothetical protein
MKIIKTVVCAMAVAVTVLCASQARAYTNTVIGTVADYSTMTIALTVKTNFETCTATCNKYEFASAKLATKDVLNILAGPDFANTTWPTGAKLEIGWDMQWNGDVLVVDSTGTNVLYDASARAGMGGASYLSLNPFYEMGPKTGTSSVTYPGTESYTWDNNANFHLVDYGAVFTSLHGLGSCTDKFSQKWDATENPTTWTDSEEYTQNEANQILLGNSGAELSGTITLSGRGSGSPWYLVNH